MASWFEKNIGKPFKKVVELSLTPIKQVLQIQTSAWGLNKDESYTEQGKAFNDFAGYDSVNQQAGFKPEYFMYAVVGSVILYFMVKEK